MPHHPAWYPDIQHSSFDFLSKRPGTSDSSTVVAARRVGPPLDPDCETRCSRPVSFQQSLLLPSYWVQVGIVRSFKLLSR